MTFTNRLLDASGFTRRSESTVETLRSFGYEWTTFDAVQPEDEAFWRRYFASVPLLELAGAVGLDAGCGKGRFTLFTAPYMDAVAALDGSDAVVSADRNLASLSNVGIVKADVTNVPFADEAFDVVWCLGVLHHLDDPRRGFDHLVGKVTPGGLILIYVYSRAARPSIRAMALAAARVMRRVTVRLPHPLLRIVSAPLAALLYLAFVVPGRIGSALGLQPLERLPLQTYRGRPLRSLWLDTFDRLSAPIENRYSWADLEPWFRSHELDVLNVVEDAGLIVLARKPGD